MNPANSVCRAWFANDPVKIVPMEASGFSGSNVWLVCREPFFSDPTAQQSRFVLKSFAGQTAVAHAQWVHRLMGYLRDTGMPEVPEIMVSQTGSTLQIDPADTLWELLRFMPGNSVQCPSPMQARMALQALAQLHTAAASMPPGPQLGASPGRLRRLAQIQQLLLVPWQERRPVLWWSHQQGQSSKNALNVPDCRPLFARLDAAIVVFEAAGGTAVLNRLLQSQAEATVLQPVLRDVWSEHVLFCNLRRLAQIQQLLLVPWQERRPVLWWSHQQGQSSKNALNVPDCRPLFARLDAAIVVFEAAGGTAVLNRLLQSQAEATVLQPVLRDVWNEHVLFCNPQEDSQHESDHGSGLAFIDFHAAGIDTPATDVARLLGSWTAPPNRQQLPLLEAWSDAIAAYERVRPLTKIERALVSLFHVTGTVLGLDNWFRWTLEEGRCFVERRRVLARIDRLIDSLGEALIEEILI